MHARLLFARTPQLHNSVQAPVADHLRLILRIARHVAEDAGQALANFDIRRRANQGVEFWEKGFRVSRWSIVETWNKLQNFFALLAHSKLLFLICMGGNEFFCLCVSLHKK